MKFDFKPEQVERIVASVMEDRGIDPNALKGFGQGSRTAADDANSLNNPREIVRG